MPTRYELYVRDWKDCTLCHYSKTRKRVVLGKASELPCDVLFIGESPGESEDVHGLPFYGQSGMVMDDIVAEAIPAGVSYGFNNLTGCYPLDANREKEDPDDDCVMICSQRLKQFVALAQPKLVVTVGKLATEWLDTANKLHIALPPGTPRVDIVHPAALLRAPYVQRDLMFARAVIVVKKAIRLHVLGEA